MMLVAKSSAMSSSLVSAMVKSEAQERWMRQKVIKRKILDEVDEASSALLRDRDPHQETVVYGCELTDRLSAGLDAVFLHGLRHRVQHAKMLWELFQQCAPENVSLEILSLPCLVTDIGLCRAFTRDILNSPGAPLGVWRVLTEERRVTSLVQELYKDFAMVRDQEDLKEMMTKLDRLQQTLTFRLRLDHPTLNRWSGLSLRLAGHHGPCLPLTPLLPPGLTATSSLQLVKASMDNPVRTPSQKATPDMKRSDTLPKKDSRFLPASSPQKKTSKKKARMADQNTKLLGLLEEPDMTSVASAKPRQTSKGENLKLSPDVTSAESVKPRQTSTSKGENQTLSSTRMASAEKAETGTKDSAEGERKEETRKSEEYPEFLSVYDAFFNRKGNLVYTSAEGEMEEVMPTTNKHTDDLYSLQEEETKNKSEPEKTTVYVVSSPDENGQNQSRDGSVASGSHLKPRLRGDTDSGAGNHPKPKEEESEFSFRKKAVCVENSSSPGKAKPEAESDPHAKLRSLIPETEVAQEEKDTKSSEESKTQETQERPAGEEGKKQKHSLKSLAQVVLVNLRGLLEVTPQQDPEKMRLLYEAFVDRYCDNYKLSTKPEQEPELLGKCAVCLLNLEQSEGRLCHLSGQLCCSNCHTYRTAVLPYHLMKDFDFKHYPVCNAAYCFLKKNETRVWIDDYCYTPGHSVTTFARKTAATICLRGNVVILNWRLGECDRAGDLVCPQQARLAEITPPFTKRIRKFSVQELHLVKENKLPKLLSQTLKKQLEHLTNCSRHLDSKSPNVELIRTRFS